MSGQVCGVVYSLLFVFKHNQLALRPRNSYILTVWILQVFTGVYPRCSRASWYKGWEPSAEFNIVSCSYSDWLVCCILFSFSLFFFPFNQQPWSCVPSQFISQAKSSWLSCGNEGSVTPACPGPLTLQGSGWTFTKLSRLCFLWRRARAARACPSPI